MTHRQKQLLDFIRAYRHEHGISPTYDEMKAALGLVSKSSVHRLVEGLVRRGLVVRHKHAVRGVGLPETLPMDSAAAQALSRAAARAGKTPSELILSTFGGQGA